MTTATKSTATKSAATQTRARRRPCRARSSPTGVQTVKVSADEAGMRRRPFPRGAVSRAVVLPYPAHHPQRRVARERQARAAQAAARGRAGGAYSAAAPGPAQAALARKRGRCQDPRFPQVDHAPRRRRRAGAQQAHGARGAGRLGHHAPSRRHARGAARRAGPAPAAGAPPRQGHRRLPAGGEDAVCGHGARQDLPHPFGAKDLLGAGRRRAQAAPGPDLDLSWPRKSARTIRSCASRATARRAPATR